MPGMAYRHRAGSKTDPRPSGSTAIFPDIVRTTCSRASGTLLWREDYTPFGEARQQPAANDNGESYTGHIADTDTGLIYMQARYYDPAIGRFLSSDPVGFASGGPAYFNRYAYVGNNPLNATDPTGMCSTDSDGNLIDCPAVTQDSNGVMIQGADFNGYHKDAVAAPDMESLAATVGVLDEITSTPAGQELLVQAQ